MSVINKMLTDLDQRQAAASPERSGVAAGTASVAPRQASTVAGERRRPWAGFALAALAGGVVAAGLWWFVGARPGSPAPVVAMTATASPASVAAPTPVAAPSSMPVAQPVPVVAPAVAVSAPAAPAVSASAPAPATVPAAATPRPVPPATVAKVEPPPVARPALAAASAPMVRAAPAAVASQAAPVAPAAPVTPAPVQRPGAAGEDLLARAQGLWNGGSREAAIVLLREGVSSLERSAASPATTGATMAPLLRELTRMELAEGRAQDAYDLLVRLEPVIVDQADLWAVRGNAAQRLGRHADSATAYLSALKIRPNEARWMLGAAVSLAVQGQLPDAGQWAQKARAAGALSVEVDNYLRQLGVPMQDR